jgi:hypothetical protein
MLVQGDYLLEPANGQCREGRMLRLTDSMDRLECWCAVKITSYGNTWTLRHTEFLYPEGGTRSLYQERQRV